MTQYRNCSRAKSILHTSLKRHQHLPRGRSLNLELNQHFFKTHRFILGFLYLWLGAFSKSVLADPKLLVQPEQSSNLISKSNESIPGTDNLLTLSNSAALLLPEKTVDAKLQLSQFNNNIDDTEEIVPLNQLDNNSTSPEPTLKVESLQRNALESTQLILPTAHQLSAGEIITNLRYRQSFPTKNVTGGFTGQPTLGITWGVTNNLELKLDAQSIDNSQPGKQGSFNAQRSTIDGGGNAFQELTLQAKQRLWQNSTGNQALSGVFAISRGVRSYRFFNATDPILVAGTNQQELVTSLEFPYTVKTSDRISFTLSPKVAFLPEDNALYFRRTPVDNPGSFGTTLGLAGGASYRINPRLSLWGDAFVPFTGNNTIDRSSGLPERAIAFNAGLRYVVNPRLATDIFISNTLGNTGALSIITDKEFPSLGLGITFIPGVTNANRRYPTSFKSTLQPPPATPAGFAFFDGGTIKSGQLLTTIQGGSQGLLTAIQYGLLDDLEIGIFLDNISGTRDESELGFSGKIRFLHQADGDPFTLSGVATVGRSNNVLVNLINNNANEFKQRGYTKSGFAFSNENQNNVEGQLYIVTLSTPINYQFPTGSAIWLTPTLGFIQRYGLQMAGLNLGGSLPVAQNLQLIAETGIDLSGKGNGFIDNKRQTVIPWSLGLRWNPSLEGITGLELEAYATNRVGSTPFHSLRVQADNPLSLGIGVRLPVQF